MECSCVLQYNSIVHELKLELKENMHSRVGGFSGNFKYGNETETKTEKVVKT